MDLSSPPIRRSHFYTEPYTLRIDRSLKLDLAKLAEEYDIDVPEWVRNIIRQGVKMQLEHLKTKPQRCR